MNEQGHNPPREATEEQIEGDEVLRRASEPTEGGYGAEQEAPQQTSDDESSVEQSETPRD